MKLFSFPEPPTVTVPNEEILSEFASCREIPACPSAAFPLNVFLVITAPLTNTPCGAVVLCFVSRRIDLKFGAVGSGVNVLLSIVTLFDLPENTPKFTKFSKVFPETRRLAVPFEMFFSSSKA